MTAIASAKLRKGICHLRDKARELVQEDASEIVARFGQMGRRRFTVAA